MATRFYILFISVFTLAMVDEAAAVVSEHATLNPSACDAYNNDACNNEVYGPKVMEGVVAEAVTVVIMLLARLTPLLLPL
ncbi:hypothetical protein [Mucilaginibacter sp.]